MRKFKQLTEKIVAEVANVIEQELNEISSTTFFDAADKADIYNNRALAKKFREAGDIRRKEELNNEYDKAIEEYGRYVHQPNENKAAKTFIVARYLPSNMPIVVLLKDVARAQIARVGHNRLVNIQDKDLAAEIAGYYNRQSVDKDNILSMSTVIGKDRNAAIKLANMINDAFDSEISWRYFYGDSFEKRSVRDTSKDYEPFKAPFAVNGMHVAMAKSVSNQTGYDIYYILFTTERKTTHMARIFKDMKGMQALGHKQPGSVWRAMCDFSVNGKPLVIAKDLRPTPESSNIVNLYPVLQNLSPDAQYELFRRLSHALGFRVTLQNFYETYAKEMGIDLRKAQSTEPTEFKFIEDDETPAAQPAKTKQEVKDFDSAFDNSDDYEDVEVNVDELPADTTSDADYPAYDDVEIETAADNSSDDFDDLDLEGYDDLDFDEEFKS